MSNFLQKLFNNHNALESERRLMDEALAQLDQTERKFNPVYPAGRLIFGLDLTASRKASLKRARIATAAMFDTIKVIGAVAVKLVYFRGDEECKAGEWHSDPTVVRRFMLGLSCKSGYTQITRMLRFVLAEKQRISGMVYIGDHCENAPETLLGLAEDLRRKSIPLFIFHECSDHDYRSLQAKPVFEQMAEISGGVYVEFDPDSAVALKELLSSVAAFSVAGAKGVEKLALAETSEARQLQRRLLLGSGGKR